MKVLFAGDWHGDVDWAAEVIARAAETGCGWVVQVGDFGFGFFRLGDDPAEPGDWAPRCEFAEGVSNLADAGVRVVFIDGNHDNPVLLGRLADLRTPEGPEGFVPVEDNLWWAPRGHRWTWDGVRFGALGGAYSNDRRRRTPGLDYWKEETTSAADVARLGPGRIDVLVCHDAPVLPAGFDPLPAGRGARSTRPAATRSPPRWPPPPPPWWFTATGTTATPPSYRSVRAWPGSRAWPPTSNATTVRCWRSTPPLSPERRCALAVDGQ